MRRRGRRRKQLMDGLKERRRCWKLKEAALDCTPWRSRLEKGYVPAVRQATCWRRIMIQSSLEGEFKSSGMKRSLHSHGRNRCYTRITFKVPIKNGWERRMCFSDAEEPSTVHRFSLNCGEVTDEVVNCFAMSFSAFFDYITAGLV
jgi:hypothetical protein